MAALLTVQATLAQGNGSISGYAFDDLNADGVRQQGEPARGGVTVTILGGSTGTTTRTTRSDGYYSLGSLPSGAYSVMPSLDTASPLSSPNGAGIFAVEHTGLGNRRVDLAYAKPCAFVVVKQVRWDVRTDNKAYVRVCVRNDSEFAWKFIKFSNLGAGVAAVPSQIELSTELLPGKSRVIDFCLTGVRPSTKQCFMMTFHSADWSRCCGVKNCVELPDCDCFQVTQTALDCFADGRWQYTFQYQSLTVGSATRVCFLPISPNNLTFGPSVINLSRAVPRGGIVNGQTTIRGRGILGGETICFWVVLKEGDRELCRKPVWLRLPACLPCHMCPCEPQVGFPNYDVKHWSQFSGQESYAAFTCATVQDSANGGVLNDDFVVAVLNLRDYQNLPPAEGNNWLFSPQPKGFHNEGSGNHVWTREAMGQVFGACIDKEGNVYVAQSSSYNSDGRPGTPGSHGIVWRLNKVTGQIVQFNVPLPNQADPGITGLALPGDPDAGLGLSQAFPELGDVTYDQDHDQVFATNMEDGKIYRYAAGGTTPKSPLNSFDPMGADGGASDPGFAPRGELLWAVKYQCDGNGNTGRLYYSVWVEDFEYVDPFNNNYIRSVAIGTNGDFIPGTDRAEATMPPLPVWRGGFTAVTNGNVLDAGLNGTSAPVSDIAFSREGVMMVAEKGMGLQIANGSPSNVQGWPFLFARATETLGSTRAARAFTNSWPHNSRGLSFVCEGGAWRFLERAGSDNIGKRDTRFSLGQHSLQHGRNSAGGVDFDPVRRHPGPYPQGPRVWFTVDYMWQESPLGNPIGTGRFYGLQGLRLNGGYEFDSILYDVDDVTANATTVKNTLGDVEFFGARP